MRIGDRNLRIGHGRNFANTKGAGQIVDQRGRNRIAVARMGGSSVTFEGQCAGCVEHRGEVKVQFELRFIRERERRGDRDASQVRVARQVIRPTVQPAFGIAP